MDTQVEFRTTMFLELPGEAEENINGFIGKAFCQWIRDELPKHGQRTEGEVIAEDFGWLCFLDCEYPLWIGCNIQGTDEQGITTYAAMVVAEFPKRIFRKGPDPKPALTAATKAFRKLIESERRLTEVNWILEEQAGR